MLKSKWVAVATAVIAIVGIGVWLQSDYGRPSGEAAQAPVSTAGESRAAHSPSRAAHRVAAIDQVESMRVWLQTQQAVASVAEANKRLSFNLRLPAAGVVASGAAPALFVAENGAGEGRAAYVAYGVPNKDVQMYAEPTPEPAFAAMAEQMRADAAEGRLNSDSSPFATDVAGMVALAVEPGTTPAGDRDVARPGVLQWWDHGVRYTIHGTWGKNGLPVKRLREIAESMYVGSR